MYEVEVLDDTSHTTSAVIGDTRTADIVWCATTGKGTWIARRDGHVFITGNSVIQGEEYHSPYPLNAITQRCAA